MSYDRFAVDVPMPRRKICSGEWKPHQLGYVANVAQSSQVSRLDERTNKLTFVQRDFLGNTSKRASSDIARRPNSDLSKHEKITTPISSQQLCTVQQSCARNAGASALAQASTRRIS